MFSQRSQEKELLDLGPEFYTAAEYADCLRKLFLINKLLGIFRGTAKLLRRFSPKSSLLDVGCGGGMFILQLSRLFPEMPMHGVDIAPAAIIQAQQSLQAWQSQTSHVQVSFQLHDSAEVTFMLQSYDIILATLVCHHLTNDELIIFLRQALRAANQAVIINDLHRHWVAYWFYKIISPLLLRNRLITHDGLISIRRGFTRTEWQS